MLALKLDIQLFSDGKVVIDTDLNTKNFENGLDKMKKVSSNAGTSIKNIVAGLGITKLISVAVSQINSSIDSAVARIDTFNQFPKVLKNFGVSADEAQESIKRIDQSVRGLPTSLDQAVSGVQNLFMVTKDLGEAERLFKAINDSAMVFANGSTEAVDRFAYAYKQALSSGKVQAQDFNQMNEAIPGLMDKVAESMGKSYIELKEGLSDGTISINEFNDALKKLDTEGGAGMEALEQVAKSSTGGIATSVTNAKTAITRGVASLIEEINKKLEESNLPNIMQIIENIGKKSETVLKSLADFIGPVIENLDTLIPMIGLLSAGFSVLNPSSILNMSDAFGSFVGIFNNGAGIITKVLSSGLGFGALGGLVLVAMGLVEQNFGDSIDKIIKIAIEEGPLIIQNLLEGINSKLPELITMGGKLLNQIITAITANLPILLQEAGKIINTLVNGLLKELPTIMKSGMELLSTLIIGIAKELPTLIPMALDIISTLVESLIDNIDLVIDAAIELIIGLAEGLIKALPLLIEKAPIIIEKLVSKLTDPDMLSKLVQVAFRLITELAIALVMSIPELLKGVNKINKSIIDGLKNIFSSLGDIGKNIVKGIWQGISNSLDWIKSKIKGWVGNVVKFMKKLFGIASPSKLMRDEVGKFLAQGIGVGFDDELDNIYKDMQKTIDIETSKLTANVQTSGTYQMAMAGTPTFNLKDNSSHYTQLEVNGRVLAEVVNTENRNREVAKS